MIAAVLLAAFLAATPWTQGDAVAPCPHGTAPKAAKTLGCALLHCCWNPQLGALSGHKCRLDGAHGEPCPEFKNGGTSQEKAQKTTLASEDYACESAQPLDDCERTSGRHVVAVDTASDGTASDASVASSGGLDGQPDQGGLRGTPPPPRPTALIKEGKDNCPMDDCINVCNQVPGQGASIGGTVKSTFEKDDFTVFCTSQNFKTGKDEGDSGLTGCLVTTPSTGHTDMFPNVQSGNYVDAVCGLPKRGSAPHLIDALKAKGDEVHLTCIPCSDTPYSGDMDSCKFRLDQYYATKLGFSYWRDGDDVSRKQMRDFNIIALMSWNE